jgi:hypothetical protein
VGEEKEGRGSLSVVENQLDGLLMHCPSRRVSSLGDTRETVTLPHAAQTSLHLRHGCAMVEGLGKGWRSEVTGWGSRMDAGASGIDGEVGERAQGMTLLLLSLLSPGLVFALW